MSSSNATMLQCLYEDDQIKLIYRPGLSAHILVTFSNFGFSPEGLSFWGQKLCDSQDIETLGFVAKRANWFPAANMACAVTQATSIAKRPIITYGHSQGAYAAIRYAAALGASAVIACAPQFSIDPSIILRDRRFTSYFRTELHDKMELQLSDHAGRVILIYDPYDVNDSEHISHICRLGYANTNHFPIYHLGHDIMEVLSQRQIILGIIQSALNGECLHQLQIKANKSKKHSMRFSLTLAEQALRKGKAETARWILDNILIRNNGILPDVVARKREILHQQATAMQTQRSAMSDGAPL